MKHFDAIQPTAFDKIFERIGKETMLISAAHEGRANTMTASWGACGVLWNKPVAICFVRPQRFTYPILENGTHFSLAFLGGEHRDALRFCGTRSGADYPDKFSAAGLQCAYTEDGVPYPEEAREVLICRKLFSERMQKESFLDEALLSHYPEDDFHQVFVGEICAYLRASDESV